MLEKRILKVVERTPLKAYQIVLELRKTMPVKRRDVYSKITELVQHQQVYSTVVNGFIAYCQRRQFDFHDFNHPIKICIAGANTRHNEGTFKLNGTIVTKRKFCKTCKGGLYANGKPHGRLCRSCYNDYKKKYNKKATPTKGVARTEKSTAK